MDSMGESQQRLLVRIYPVFRLAASRSRRARVSETKQYRPQMGTGTRKPRQAHREACLRLELPPQLHKHNNLINPDVQKVNKIQNQTVGMCQALILLIDHLPLLRN